MSGLKGVDKCIRNLNKEIKNIEGRSMKGMIRATIFIRKQMDKVQPLIPVDTGNLRGSWATEPLYLSKGPAIMMGFVASYAWFVHEMADRKDRRINWSRPGSGPKFLQAPLKRDVKQILNIIAKDARIK